MSHAAARLVTLLAVLLLLGGATFLYVQRGSGLLIDLSAAAGSILCF